MDLEMKRSWIIQVGPNSNDKCSNKRHNGDQTDRRKAHVKMEAEIVQECQQPPEAENGTERNVPSPLEGAQPCQHLHFRLLPPEVGGNKFLF